MEGARFAVIDTETTGLDAGLDRVVSVAVVPVEDGAIRYDLAREVLVDPGLPIPPASTAVHGISDSDVRGARDLVSAIAELAPLLAGRVVVGHNLEFDLAFLSAGGMVAGPTLDTLAVSRLLWPARGVRHALDDLAGRVEVRPKDRHTALGDAVATAEALVACLPLLHQRGLDTPEEIAEAYRAQRVRRARVRRSAIRRLLAGRPVVGRSAGGRGARGGAQRGGAPRGGAPPGGAQPSSVSHIFATPSAATARAATPSAVRRSALRRRAATPRAATPRAVRRSSLRRSTRRWKVRHRRASPSAAPRL